MERVVNRDIFLGVRELGRGNAVFGPVLWNSIEIGVWEGKEGGRVVGNYSERKMFWK